MDICKWEKFCCGRCNLSFLRSALIEYNNDKLFLILIKLQINGMVLLLCINRIVPDVCVIICKYIQAHINYFRPEKYEMNKDFIFESRIEYARSLDVTFEHCKDKKSHLYNLRQNDMTELKKYLQIGYVGSFSMPCFNRDYYVIIDINHEYNTVSIIEEMYVGRKPYIPKKGCVKMFTFDDFISYGSKKMGNYISNIIVKLDYSITKIS